MKKVLVLIGSPRKGNSLAAAGKVEEVLAEKDIQVEYVFLAEMRIELCRGCFACLRNGIASCPIDDDIPSIMDRMRSSDGIIFVSPVYVMSVSGLMKNFLDRLSSICHRPVFCRQYAMVLATVGAIGLKDTLRYMAGATGSWQFRKVVELGIKTPHAFDTDRNMTNGNLRTIRRQSLRFREMLLNGRHVSPCMSQVLQFRLQRAIFTGAAASDWPADRKFYEALADRKYYCDVKVNPLYNFLGAVAEKMTRWFTGGREEERKAADE